MKRFRLEHRRQRAEKAVIFIAIVLVTAFVYIDYGRSTGFVAYGESSDIFYRALQNEQVRLFAESHEYVLRIRELDYVTLQLTDRPDRYAGLRSPLLEVELSAGTASIVAVLYEGRVVKTYNPAIE